MIAPEKYRVFVVVVIGILVSVLVDATQHYLKAGAN